MFNFIRCTVIRTARLLGLTILMMLWQTSPGSCQVAADAPRLELAESASPPSAKQGTAKVAAEDGNKPANATPGDASTDIGTDTKPPANLPSTKADPKPLPEQPPTDSKAPPESTPGQPPTDSKAGPRPNPNERRPVDAADSLPKARSWISWLQIVIWTLVGLVALGTAAAMLRSSTRRPDRPAKLPPSSNIDPNARAAFARHHSAFNDLYGEIWQAAEALDISDAERRQIMIRWHERLKRVGDDDLLQAWSKLGLSQDSQRAYDLQKQAIAWLDRLESWGLGRECPPEIKIDKYVLSKFHVLPKSEDGIAVVKSPCWTFGGRVLEKGLAVSQAAMPR